MKRLFTPLPIYVTRRTADGVIGTLSIGAVWALLVLGWVTFNAIAWGLVGLIEAGRVVAGL